MPLTCNQCTWIRSAAGTETYIAVWLAPKFHPTTGCLISNELDVWACVNQAANAYEQAPGSAKPTKITDLKFELDLSKLCGASAFHLDLALQGTHTVGGNEGQPAFLTQNVCGQSPGAYPVVVLNSAQNWLVNLQASAPTHVAVLKFKDAECTSAVNAVKIGSSAPLIQFTENAPTNTHGQSTQNPAARHSVTLEFASGNTKIQYFSETNGQTGIGATNTHAGSSNNFRFVLGPPIGGANSVHPIDVSSAGDTCTTLYKDWSMLKYTDESGNNNINGNPGYFLDVVATTNASIATVRAGYSAGQVAQGFSKVQFRFGYKSGVSNTPPSDSGITITSLAGGAAKNANKGWTTSLSSVGKSGDTDWYDVTMSSPVDGNGAATKPIYDWELYTYANGGGNDVLVSASFSGGTMRNSDSFVICKSGIDVRMSTGHGVANSAGELSAGGNLLCQTLAANCNPATIEPSLDYCVDSAAGGSAADCPDWSWLYNDDITAGVQDGEAAIGFGCYEEGGGQQQNNLTVVGGTSSFKIYACRIGGSQPSFTHVDGLTTKLRLPDGVHIQSMTSPFTGVATYTNASSTPTITLSASNNGQRIDMSSACESALCTITLTKQLNLDSDIEQAYPAAPVSIDWYTDDYWAAAAGSTPFSHSLSVVPAGGATVLTSSKYEASQVMQCKQFPNMQLQLGPWMDRVTAPVTGGCFITPGVHSPSAVWGTSSYPQYGYGNMHIWLEPVLTGSSGAPIAHSDGVAGHYITDEIDVKYSQAESHGIDHVEFGVQVMNDAVYHTGITGSLVDPPGYAEVLIAGAITVNQTITLVSNEGNTSLVYTAKGSENLGSRQFNQSGNIAATAASLKDCINHASGHNGKIIASVKNSGAGNGNDTVVLEQKPAAANANGYKAISSTLANTTVSNAGFIANNVHKNGGMADTASAAWTLVNSSNSNISCSFFDLRSTTRASDIYAKTGTLCRIRLGSATASSEPWASVWSNSGSAYYDPSPTIGINKDRLWAYQADDKPTTSTKWKGAGNLGGGAFSQDASIITPAPSAILTPSVFAAGYPRLNGSQYTTHGRMTGVKITAKLSQSVTAYEFKLQNVPVNVDTDGNIFNMVPYWNWNFGHDATNADPAWSGSVQQGWSYVDPASYTAAGGTPLTGTVDVWVAGFITGSKTSDALPKGASQWIGTLLYRRHSAKYPTGVGWTTNEVKADPLTAAKLGAVTVNAASVKFYGATDDHSVWQQTAPMFAGEGKLNTTGNINRCDYDGGISTIGDMDSTSLVNINALGGPYAVTGTISTYGTASTGVNACAGTLTVAGSTIREGWMASHEDTVTAYSDLNGLSYGTHWTFMDADHSGLITIRDIIAQRRYVLSGTDFTGSFNTNTTMGDGYVAPTTGSSTTFPRYTYPPLMPPPLHHVPVKMSSTTVGFQLVPVSDTYAFTDCQKRSGLRVVNASNGQYKTKRKTLASYNMTLQYQTDTEMNGSDVNADSFITAIEFTIDGFAKKKGSTGGVITPIQIPFDSPLYKAGCKTLVSEPFLVGSSYRQTVTIFNAGMSAIADPSTAFKDLCRIRTKGPFVSGRKPKMLSARIVSNGHQSVSPLTTSGCGSTSGFGSLKQAANSGWTGDDGTGHVSGDSLVWLYDLIQKRRVPTTGTAAAASFIFDNTTHKQTNNGTATLTSITAAGVETAVAYKIKNDGTAVGSNNEFNACANKLGTAANFVAAVSGQARGSIVFSNFPNVAGTATMTFIDKPNEGSTITLTDYENTSKTFEIDDTNDGVQTGGAIAVTEIGENGGGGVGTAVDLAAKINASPLKITAAAPGSGVLNLTQDQGGTVGNKAIAYNNSSHWNAMVSQSTAPTAFTGGTSDETFTLTDAAGTARGFVFKTGVATEDGSADGNNNFIIGLSGLADVTALATRVKTVINTQTAVAITASVGASAGVVVLVQDAAGTAGNKTISGNASNSTLNNLTGGGGGHFGKLTVANAGGGTVNITQGSIGAARNVDGNKKMVYTAGFQKILTAAGNPRRFSNGKTKTSHFWAKTTNYTSNDRFDVFDVVALHTYIIDRAVNVSGKYKAYAPGTNNGPPVGTVKHAPSDQCGTPYCKDIPS